MNDQENYLNPPEAATRKRGGSMSEMGSKLRATMERLHAEAKARNEGVRQAMTKDESRTGLEALRNQLLASGVPCAALGAFEDEIRAEAAERAVKWYTQVFCIPNNEERIEKLTRGLRNYIMGEAKK